MAQIGHHFYEQAPQQGAGGCLETPRGSFCGMFYMRAGKIHQNSHNAAGFGDVAQALDTALHEATHAVHLSLAICLADRHIKPDHPLAAEATYYAHIYKAGTSIPQDLHSKAYLAQTHEKLARLQGRVLSEGVLELAGR